MDQFYQIIIRVPKKESAFTYFTLEANEGICFYSTLEESLRQPYRDIEVMGSPEFYDEAKRVLSILQEKFPITYLGDIELIEKDLHCD